MVSVNVKQHSNNKQEEEKITLAVLAPYGIHLSMYHLPLYEYSITPSVQRGNPTTHTHTHIHTHTHLYFFPLEKKASKKASKTANVGLSSVG